MERRKHQLTCFRRSHGNAHSLIVTHLAQQDNIGRLPESRSQGIGVAFRINAYLTLADNALFVLVEELDRVLNGNDMPRALAVYLVYHTGKGGGFSAACRSRYKDNAVLVLRQ